MGYTHFMNYDIANNLSKMIERLEAYELKVQIRLDEATTSREIVAAKNELMKVQARLAKRQRQFDSL